MWLFMDAVLLDNLLSLAILFLNVHFMRCAQALSDAVKGGFGGSYFEDGGWNREWGLLVACGAL